MSYNIHKGPDLFLQFGMLYEDTTFERGLGKWSMTNLV